MTSYDDACDEICILVGAMQGVSPDRVTVDWSDENASKGWDYQVFDVRIDGFNSPSFLSIERRKPRLVEDNRVMADRWTEFKLKLLQTILIIVRKRCHAVVRAVAKVESMRKT